MYLKALATYLILIAVILGVNVCSVLANDVFYLKDGLYVPEKDQCYKIENEYHPEGKEYTGDGIYVQTKNGSVFKIFLGVGQRYEFLKVIKKDGNLYTVLFGLKPGGQMGDSTVQQDSNVYKVYSETSFSWLSVTSDGLPDKSFKPVKYKYCEGQYEFDAHEGNEKKNNLSKSNTTSVQKQNSKQIAKDITGTWSGYFPVKNSNGKSYMLNMTYVISRDSAKVGMYHFTQTSFLKFDDPADVFGCSNTNSYSNTYQGDIIEEQVGYKFIQKTVSNPKCGTTDVDLYRLNGDRINAVNVNGGKITSGYLTRN